MAILEIVTVPDPRLKKPSLPIENIDDDIRRLAADMAETMYAAPGVGLAAVQVGRHLQLITMDVVQQEEKSEDKRELITLINPEIVEQEGKIIWEEGCLSVPGIFEDINRYRKIAVEYLDLDGNSKRIEAEEFMAVVIQHEIDHTKGKVFLDYLSPLKRKLLIRKAARNAKDALLDLEEV